MKQNHTRKEVTRRKNTQSVKNQKADFPEAIGLAPCLGRSDQPCFSHRARSCPGLGSDTWLEVTSAFPPLLRRLGANILLLVPWVHLWLAVGCGGVRQPSRLAPERG